MGLTGNKEIKEDVQVVRNRKIGSITKIRYHAARVKEGTLKEGSKVSKLIMEGESCIFFNRGFVEVADALLRECDIVTPKTSHLNVVKRIFKYLKGKPNLGLWYPRESPFDLKAFSDSDYDGSNLDKKSTTDSLHAKTLAVGTLEFMHVLILLRIPITEASIRTILTLVDRVKTLKVASKRKTKRVLLSDSEEEETEAHRRKTHDLDPLVSLVQKLVTPSKTVNDSGEEQVEDISPTTLKAAAILTKVQKFKRSKVKSAFEKINTGGIRVSVPSLDRGRREGKAPITKEEETQASRKTKEQILQEEAGLAEAIRLDALEKEEVAKQAQVQFEAQSYTEEDWDTIGAKLEANAKLKESLLGKDLTVEDYAKRMIELVNQRRKHFAEERARAKRNKPMTQTQLRNYMSNFLKNQGTWKLTQLKKLNFEEVKAEFENLVKQLDTYVPMNFEATKESLKRFSEELQTKTAKKLKFDDEGTQPTEEKIEEDKDDKPTKKTGKRRKQIARKGFHTDHDRDEYEDSDEANEKDDSTSGTKIPIDPVPITTKSPSIA
ncbi:hypothetical protein Tco_0996323, partial [Tanacetum coccineum]